MSIKDEEPDWAPGSVAAQKEQKMPKQSQDKCINQVDPGDHVPSHIYVQGVSRRYDEFDAGTVLRSDDDLLYLVDEMSPGFVYLYPYGQEAPKRIKPAPNYEADVEVVDQTAMLWINLGIPAEIVPQHTQEILRTVVSDALALWVRRNVEYGDEAKELGAKGQYADINRKVRKLKRLLWDENVPQWAISEDVEQVIMDLIGHCILTIDLLRKGNKHGN